MFRRNSAPPALPTGKSAHRKTPIPAIISQDMNILGNIVSDGMVDFNGTLDGNIRAHILTVRANALIKGEVIADSLFVYGKIKGLLRARHVHLYASCNVEGVIMHEHITIEEGAFVDGKFKRTDKIAGTTERLTVEDEETPGSDLKLLENLQLVEYS